MRTLLVITDDRHLADQVLRLCAAAGMTPDVVSGANPGRRLWRQAGGVLVGADAVAAVAGSGLPRRDGVVLVSSGPVSAALWQHALTVHADSVVVLPDGATDLIARLSDLLDGAESSCLTAGIVAARGGGGASTVTAALGLTAARRGVPTLLIDADAMGGGIDLVVGCEDLAGLRWSEVAATSGRVSSSALRSALPTVDELSVLSWDRGKDVRLDAATMRSMLSAGQRGSRLVLVDLPRRFDDGAAEAAACCDVVAVVCPTDVLAIAGAARLSPGLREVVADVRLVVRRGGRPATSPETVSDLLSLPLLGSVPTTSRIARSIDAGLGIPARGPLTRACLGLLRELGVSTEQR